jgi:hypothetical protein
MATLAYMLILASRSSILQTPVPHPASNSTALQAASNASDTHKLLTLVRGSFSDNASAACCVIKYRAVIHRCWWADSMLPGHACSLLR